MSEKLNIGVFAVEDIILLQENTPFFEKGCEFFITGINTIAPIPPLETNMSQEDLYKHLKDFCFKRIGTSKINYGQKFDVASASSIFKIDKLTDITSRIFVSNYVITYNKKSNKLRVFDSKANVEVFNTEFKP
jgi:hypothetical protein